jgi:hypothetical protein
MKSNEEPQDDLEEEKKVEARYFILFQWAVLGSDQILSPTAAGFLV